MSKDPVGAPLLIHDLLRAAPTHIRSQSSLPLTSLEDVVTLFDASTADNCNLATAILLYHLEAYRTYFHQDKRFAKIDLIDGDFASFKLQKVVESIY